jgi:hypothetical protein
VSDDICIRWSVDLKDQHLSGEVTVLRVDWDMTSPDDRYWLVRGEVGSAVLRALDVDWTVTNACIDDPNR